MNIVALFVAVLLQLASLSFDELHQTIEALASELSNEWGGYDG